MGASGTPLMYAFREREKILDLFESLTGSRMMCNYMRFGGCRVDAPPAWLDAARKARRRPAAASSTSLRTCSRGNEILMARTQGVGVLRPELAVNAGVTGPMLRASGVDYDIRKVDDYGIYDRFKFRVPLGDHGDVYDRYMIRMLEMRESIKILEQALQRHSRRPDHGPQGQDPRLPAQAGRSLRPHRSARKAKSAFTSSATAARIPIATASARQASSTSLCSKICVSAHNVADVVLIFGSVDIVLGEVDR